MTARATIFLIPALAVFLLTSCSDQAKPESPTVEIPSPTDQAFAQEALAIVDKAQGTPAQELANLLTDPKDWRHSFLQQLLGKKPAKAGQLAAARRILEPIVQDMRKGPDWPAPPRVRVPFAAQAPMIDGKLDDPAWKSALTFTGLYPFNQNTRSADPATTFRMLWDADTLYFAFDCADKDLVAPALARDDNVFFHDCVEIFLLPDFSRGLYWEIVVSPSQSIFDSLHCKYRDRWGSYARTDQDMKNLRVGVQVRGTLNQPGDEDQGYTVEIALPRQELPEYAYAPLAAGQHLRFMLVRLDKTGEEHKAYAFIPLLAWGHNIWNHADMELVK